VFVYYDCFTRGGERLCFVSHLSQAACVSEQYKEERKKKRNNNANNENTKYATTTRKRKITISECMKVANGLTDRVWK